MIIIRGGGEDQPFRDGLHPTSWLLNGFDTESAEAVPRTFNVSSAGEE